MKNAHGLITGTTGSGKSTYVRGLLRELPRWLAVDPQADYREPADRSTSDPMKLADWLLAHGRGPRFRVAYEASTEGEAAAAFAMVWELYRREKLRPPPLLLVVDEAHLWSDPRSLMEELGRIARSGRKWGLHLLSITPRDVDIHRTVRILAAIKVAFRQDAGFSDDFARSWFAGRLEEVAALSALDWPREKRPTAGRHFLTDPPGTDPVAFYKRALSG